MKRYETTDPEHLNPLTGEQKNVKTTDIYAESRIFCIFRVVLGCLMDIYAMLYTKMFNGFDKMKHFKTF